MNKPETLAVNLLQSRDRQILLFALINDVC
jgi:hypothetical protein